MVNQWIRSSLVLCCLLGACASNATLRPAETSRQTRGVQLKRFALEVQVPSENGSGWNLLANGGALRSGARYSLALTVEEPLFLYVEQQSAKKTQWRWPLAGTSAERQSKSQALLIPTQGFLTLDEKPGTEWIHVVAATAPLSEEALRNEMQRLAQEAARNGAAESNSRNRGEPVWGGLDGRGMGSISFKIEHE